MGRLLFFKSGIYPGPSDAFEKVGGGFPWAKGVNESVTAGAAEKGVDGEEVAVAGTFIFAREAGIDGQLAAFFGGGLSARGEMLEDIEKSGISALLAEVGSWPSFHFIVENRHGGIVARGENFHQESRGGGAPGGGWSASRGGVNSLTFGQKGVFSGGVTLVTPVTPEKISSL